MITLESDVRHSSECFPQPVCVATTNDRSHQQLVCGQAVGCMEFIKERKCKNQLHSKSGLMLITSVFVTFFFIMLVRG